MAQAKVKYEFGLTLDLGEYQSARVSASIELPCDVDKTSETYDEAVEFVTERIYAEIENIKELRKVVKKGR